MNVKQRRFFYLSLCLFFLLSAPLLLFYASGRIFQFSERKFTKTGVCVVDSYPRNADIYINGELTKKRTPAKISNLRPGEYNLEIKKTGYQNWRKNLNIYANYTTFAENIYLFKNKPKLTALTPAVDLQESVMSPDGQFLAFLVTTEKNTNLYLKKLSDGSTNITTLPAKVEQLKWWGENLFAEKQSGGVPDYLFITPSSSTIKGLSEISSLKFTSLISGKNHTLWGLGENNIYQINPSENSINKFSPEKFDDLSFQNDLIFALQSSETATNLKSINTNNQEEKNVFSLPKGNYSFEKLNDQSFLVKGKNFFYLCQAGAENPCQEIDHKMTAAQLSPDKKKLLYFNEFELWIYELKTQENALLVRSAETISQAFWLINSDYILINFNNNHLIAQETDQRSTINYHELFLTNGQVAAIPPTINGQLLFSLKNDQKQQNGLYSLKY
ncbi:MAG: PEGA domain-containing protein [Patescibacteria group bacterium]